MKLSKKSLDPSDQKMLEECLDKPVGDLTEPEKAFLRARVDYLTEAERKAHIGIYKK